jgi:hypothetical protein
VTGDEYKGNFVKGRRNGQGYLYWASGDLYIGEWKQDKKHGQGVMLWKINEG